eukprot:908376-Rhodomonas_salina.1
MTGMRLVSSEHVSHGTDLQEPNKLSLQANVYPFPPFRCARLSHPRTSASSYRISAKLGSAIVVVNGMMPGHGMH